MVAAPQRHSVELQAQETDKRLRADLRNNAESSRVHALPRSSQDVPDDFSALAPRITARRALGLAPSRTAAVSPTYGACGH
jgi:hypothetical protein